MHAIQIRNVPDELYTRLKKISKIHHRTLSGETLAILEKNLCETDSRDSLFTQISSVREEIRNTYGTSESSLKTIKEDRAR
jgi:plasmid stability protein